ncbi:MAG TPA: ATP-binding protein, partial [Thermoprotei archaeon]|nr:ATP-binding protein [Thermoprotei archaeon]
MLVIPYFDPKPKRRRIDLYNRRDELNKLIEYMKDSPLILLLGLRRTGKTSLLYTAVNESKIPCIIFDLREIPGDGFIAMDVFLKFFLDKINLFLEKNRGIAERFIEAVKRVEEISIAGLKIRIKNMYRGVNIIELFRALNNVAESIGINIVLAFDEAQELRRIMRYRFTRILAYIYDFFENISILLTGSQIGLLYNFLRINDPESPLYGRAYDKIYLKNFTPRMSREFLIQGYKQYGIDPPEELIEYAVSKLDGVVGWLTLLGYRSVRDKIFNKKIVDEVLDIASRIAFNEFKHFLALRWQARDRYISIMRNLAIRELTWSQLKRLVEL